MMGAIGGLVNNRVAGGLRKRGPTVDRQSRGSLATRRPALLFVVNSAADDKAGRTSTRRRTSCPGNTRIKSHAGADLDDRRGAAEAPPQMARGARVCDREKYLQPYNLRVDIYLVVIPPDVLF